MVLWMVLVACGSGEEPLRSQPTEATVELGGEPGDEQEITWSALADLFGEEPVPRPLEGLTPGMPGSEVQAIFDGARPPGMPIRTTEVEGHVVISAGVKDYPMVTMSLTLKDDDRSLRGIDVAMPADQALAELGARWGSPDETGTSEVSEGMRYTWHHEGSPWHAVLQEIGDGRAVLELEPGA